MWKLVKREWWFGVKLREIDVDKGRRFAGMELLPPPVDEKKLPVGKRVFRALF